MAPNNRTHQAQQLNTTDNSEPLSAKGGQTQQEEVVQRPKDQSQVQETKNRSGAPSVRLDMDLELDIELKSKINGDLTLAIL